MKLRNAILSVLVITPVAANAQSAPPDDGYCDFVEGAAAATAAPLLSPELFGQFGYIEQSSFGVNPDPMAPDPSDLRLLGGIRYSLSNIYTGAVTKSRARAECRRHKALVAIRGITAGRATAARVAVYDQARPEADRMMQAMATDLEQRRVTLQEATAMKLRVEQLRALAADARRELAALPPQDQRPLASLLTEFRGADAEVESNEGKLRSAQNYNVSVRVGVDKFLNGVNTDPRWFGVVQLGLNLGVLFTGDGNARAAAGRKRYARSGNDPLVATTNATVDQLRALIAVDTERSQQMAHLVADLGQQLEILAKVGTDDTARLRQTLWFDWVKAKADLAYLQAHVAAMQEIVGAHAQAR